MTYPIPDTLSFSFPCSKAGFHITTKTNTSSSWRAWARRPVYKCIISIWHHRKTGNNTMLHKHHQIGQRGLAGGSGEVGEAVSSPREPQIQSYTSVCVRLHSDPLHTWGLAVLLQCSPHLPVFGKITGFSSIQQLLCRVTVWEESMKGRYLNVSDISSTKPQWFPQRTLDKTQAGEV